MSVSVSRGNKTAAVRPEAPVEECRLDAVVVVDVVHVAEVRRRSGHVGVQIGGAMP